MQKSSTLFLVLGILSVQTDIGLGRPESALQQGLKALGIIDQIDKTFTGFKYCPPPYYHVLGECFYVHQYIPQLTWAEAQEFCRYSGGIGAEPKYYGALIAQLFNMGKAKEIFNGELIHIWLGGKREGNSTTFKWSSSGDIIEGVGEEESSPTPINDFYVDIEEGDCVMLVLSRRGGPSRMRPMDCDARVHYACQLV